ncbi:transglycosylase SLT domain-containing protein [Clostridium perfringens]
MKNSKIKTGYVKDSNNKKINTQKVYKEKVAKKTQFERLNTVKKDVINKAVDTLKSEDETVNTTSSAIYEARGQIRNIKDVSKTAIKTAKIVSGKGKFNSKTKNAVDLVKNIHSPYIPTNKVESDTSDVGIQSISKAKENANKVYRAYKFINPKKYNKTFKHRIRDKSKIYTSKDNLNKTESIEKSFKEIAQEKRKHDLGSNFERINKKNSINRHINIDSKGNIKTTKDNKGKILTRRKNNVGIKDLKSDVISRRNIKDTNFGVDFRKNKLINQKGINKKGFSKIRTIKGSNIKSLSKKTINSKRALGINLKNKFKKNPRYLKSRIRKLKTLITNSAKKIIDIIKAPKKLAIIGAILGGVFLLMTIVDSVGGVLATVSTTLPNIENPKEWINNMNQIDQLENKKIHSGDYFVLKNPNVQADWRDVIAVIMAKYENNPPNGATSSTVSTDKTTVTGTYKDIINSVGQKYNVDPALICAVIKQESDFNPNEHSSAGAMGLMQLMPENCQEYGVTNPYDPYQNIVGGTRQLADLIKMYNGNLPLVLAGYNAGIGNVQKYGGVPPFPETQDYIVKVTAYYEAYKNGKPLPDGTITGTVSDVANGDLQQIYNLFNETTESKDEYGDTTITLTKHDIDYVMNVLKFTENQKQMAHAMKEANLFGETFKDFKFNFKLDIPKGAESGKPIPMNITGKDLEGVEFNTTNKNRQAVINTALKLVGKVKYFWGGKSPKGWNNAWGKDMVVTAPGSSTTGTTRPYGLDCSGFIGWVYDTAGITDLYQKGGTNFQWDNSTRISRKEAKAGDLVFNSDCSHVGIYIGEKNGKPVFVECSSSKGVTISSWNGFTEYRRPNINFGKD